MLTGATTPVDGSPANAVMWTVSAVAERDGVSKQAVSKKVRELADKHGLSVERNPLGHIVRLNVAEYDHLRGRYSDPSKAQAPQRQPADQPPPTLSSESYDEAIRQKTWLEAEKRRIELDELRGLLVRAAVVREAVVKCGEGLVAIIDQLPNVADDLAVAIGRDGVSGARQFLKKHAAKMREEMATALAALAAQTPEEGPP